MARNRYQPSEEVKIVQQPELSEELPSALVELPLETTVGELLHRLAEEPGNTGLIHQLSELLKSDS